MRIVQAGDQQLLSLEPEREVLEDLVSQAGFNCKIEESDRQVVLEVSPASPSDPILLFDAVQPANLGWFSRCQFYVDGFSGAVLQTPLRIANCRDAKGKPLHRLRIAVSTELPTSYRVPGHDQVSEQIVYTVLYNLLVALRETGVAVCGGTGVEPLAGPRSGEPKPAKFSPRPR